MIFFVIKLLLQEFAVSNPNFYSSPFDHPAYPPPSNQYPFPLPIEVPRIRKRLIPTNSFQPPSLLPLAGYCEKCCKLTTYRYDLFLFFILKGFDLFDNV